MTVRLNCLPAGDDPGRFASFVVAPARRTATAIRGDTLAGGIAPAEEGYFLTIYGVAPDGGVEAVHDDLEVGAVRTLAALAEATGRPVAFRDTRRETPPGTIEDLAAGLGSLIASELSGGATIDADGGIS